MNYTEILQINNPNHKYWGRGGVKTVTNSFAQHPCKRNVIEKRLHGIAANEKHTFKIKHDPIFVCTVHLQTKHE